MPATALADAQQRRRPRFAPWGSRKPIAYARAHQPVMRAALARTAAEKAAADVPRAAWLPRFGATAQIFGGTANQTTGSYVTTRSVDLPRIGGTRATAGSFNPYASTLVGAGGKLRSSSTLGRIAAQTAAADAPG